jgi:uncharacterized MAPEG superfamily protein
MAYEYQMLLFMTLFFVIAWFPASIAKGNTFGTKWLASNREPVIGKSLPEWGNRAERAYANLKDYFPAFVVAVLLLGIHGKFDGTTKWATTFYLIGRILHMTFYIMGNFPGRFFSYILSFSANLYLLGKLFFI